MANEVDEFKPTPITNMVREINSSMLQITMNGPLLEPYVCAAVVQEADRIERLPNADDEQSKRLAEVLVGSYPKREVNDPAIYARAITSIFNEFPIEVAKEAINRITRTLKFLPTRADVFETCSNVRAQSKIAASVGRVHLTEHARRETLAKHLARAKTDTEGRGDDGQAEGAGEEQSPQ
jgi:hypothetical protein